MNSLGEPEEKLLTVHCMLWYKKNTCWPHLILLEVGGYNTSNIMLLMTEILDHLIESLPLFLVR